MRILIIGGTGFIGYHAVQESLHRGHTVTVLALSPLPGDSLFPQDVQIILTDFNAQSDEKMLGLLKT